MAKPLSFADKGLSSGCVFMIHIEVYPRSNMNADYIRARSTACQREHADPDQEPVFYALMSGGSENAINARLFMEVTEAYLHALKAAGGPREADGKTAGLARIERKGE